MTVIALDLRGVGKSSRPNEPYTLDTLVEDIKDLLEYLEIQEPVHLCGFSNGGFIVQKFVLKYPSLVKTILLFESGPYVPPLTYEQFLKFLETSVKDATPEKIIQIMLPNMFSLSFRKKLKRDKELFELYKNDMGLICQLKNPPRYQDYINQWMASKDFDTRELLHKITIGKDGLIIRYRDRSGLFLPQVPVEQGWNVEEYLTNLCYKAGLSPDTWLEKEASILYFQGQIFSEVKPNGMIKENKMQ